MQVEKEKESLRLELNKAKSQIKEADTAVSAQNSEIEKLNHIINEADQERLRQRKVCADQPQLPLHGMLQIAIVLQAQLGLRRQQLDHHGKGLMHQALMEIKTYVPFGTAVGGVFQSSLAHDEGVSLQQRTSGSGGFLHRGMAYVIPSVPPQALGWRLPFLNASWCLLTLSRVHHECRHGVVVWQG
jgi:hypothetical protein